MVFKIDVPPGLLGEMTTAIARPARSGGTTEVAATNAAAMNRPWIAPVSAMLSISRKGLYLKRQRYGFDTSTDAQDLT